MLDTAVLDALGGADPAALLDDFLATTRDDLHVLERLHEAGDLPGLTRQAHKIKGAARLVGAQALADAAAALEAAGRRGDWAGVLPLAADLRTAVEQLRLHVEARARG